MHKLYAEYSVDLDQHLDSLEAFYVSENILESASAQSKLDFLQSVVDSTQPALNYRSNIGKLHTSIPQLPDDIRNCALREFSERELDNTKEQKIINDVTHLKRHMDM